MAIKTIPYKDHRAIVDALTCRLDELEAEVSYATQKNAALRKRIDYLTDPDSEQAENEARDRFVYSLDKNNELIVKNEPQTLADVLEEAERLEDEKKENDAVRSLEDIEQDVEIEMTLACRINTLEMDVNVHIERIDDLVERVSELEDLYAKSLKEITELKKLSQVKPDDTAEDLMDEVHEISINVTELSGGLDEHELRLSAVERELENLQNKVNGK